MDASRFDTLVKSIGTIDTRRALLRFLAALPLSAGLTVLLDAESAAAGRRQRRKAKHRHHTGDDKENRTGQRKGKRKKGKKKKKGKATRTSPQSPACQPESRAQTCAGKCGTISNRCGTRVDCGSCACDPLCEACFFCDPASGTCVVDETQVGDDCGQPGQVCQADGTCACEADSCTTGQRCDGTNCVCDDTSCGAGCCDGASCQAGTDRTACGSGGAACEACSGVCVSNSCTTCSPSNPCPAGLCCSAGSCVTTCPEDQTCNGVMCTAFAYECPGPPQSPLWSTATHRLAQTFTASQSGSLVQIALPVFKESGSTGDYHVDLLEVVGGVPTNTVLAQATIDNASVPGDVYSTLTATFSGPPLVDGTEYAVAISRPNSSTRSFAVSPRSGNACAGTLFSQSSIGTGPFVILPIFRLDLIVTVTVLP